MKGLFGRGDDTVGNPHRAQISQFEVFELNLVWKLDKQFPVEQLEATSISVNSTLPPSYKHPACLIMGSTRSGPYFKGVRIPQTQATPREIRPASSVCTVERIPLSEWCLPVALGALCRIEGKITMIPIFTIITIITVITITTIITIITTITIITLPTPMELSR